MIFVLLAALMEPAPANIDYVGVTAGRHISYVEALELVGVTGESVPLVVDDTYAEEYASQLAVHYLGVIAVLRPEHPGWQALGQRPLLIKLYREANGKVHRDQRIVRPPFTESTARWLRE